MPWYRIYANHGPGHQSSSEFYEYFSAKLSKESRENAWNERFDTGRYNWPIGDVELVKGLPAHILKNKIADAEEAIRSYTASLKVLRKDTPSIPVIAVHFVGRSIPGKVSFSRTDERKSIPVFEARLLGRPEATATGTTRDKAVASLCKLLHVRKRSYAVIVQ